MVARCLRKELHEGARQAVERPPSSPSGEEWREEVRQHGSPIAGSTQTIQKMTISPRGHFPAHVQCWCHSTFQLLNLGSLFHFLSLAIIDPNFPASAPD